MPRRKASDPLRGMYQRNGIWWLSSDGRGHKIKPTSLGTREIKLALKKDKNTQFVVEGHACHSAGSKKYNLALSDRRAAEYGKQLVKVGVPKEALFLVGRGEEMPIVFVGNAQEQAPNRRVEVYPIFQHKTV